MENLLSDKQISGLLDSDLTTKIKIRTYLHVYVSRINIATPQLKTNFPESL
jgi:hypothetical protein